MGCWVPLIFMTCGAMSNENRGIEFVDYLFRLTVRPSAAHPLAYNPAAKQFDGDGCRPVVHASRRARCHPRCRRDSSRYRCELEMRHFKPSIWHVARVTVAEVRTQDQSRAHRLGQRRGGVVYLGVGVNMLPRYPACGCGCISSISGQHI